MAKVKNPNPPVRWEMGVGAPHDPLYFGPMYRAIMPDASPQSADSDWSIEKKTTQGRHPASRGFKKIRQGRSRAAFQACSGYFANLPENCDDADKCYVGPTKDSVNKLKQSFGIKCSYIDLFMRCCIKTLYANSGSWSSDLVTGCAPDKCDSCCSMDFPLSSYSICDGDKQNLKIISHNVDSEIVWVAVFEDDSSLDLYAGNETNFTAKLKDNQTSSHCIIYIYDRGKVCHQIDINVHSACPDDARIVYTTNIMMVSESQNLEVFYTATNCGTPVFKWVIASGGGTLNINTGEVVQYTAPATNPGCSLNVTINLTCNDIIVDSLYITFINAPAGQNAYEIRKRGPEMPYDCWICPDDCCFGSLFRFYRHIYDCFGNMINDQSTLCEGTCGGDPTTCSSGFISCITWEGAGGVIDLRTDTLKAMGCCPMVLM